MSAYIGAHAWSTERVARKRHTCEWCRKPIEPGTRYMEHRASPAHEFVGDHWNRIRDHLRGDDGLCIR